MTYNTRVLSVRSMKDALQELREIRTDPFAVLSLSSKMVYINLKLEGVGCEVADILEQEMRSIGGDAAVAQRVARGAIGSTDVILVGSYNHFRRLIEKVNLQPFGQNGLVDEIEDAIDNFDKDGFVIRSKKAHLDLSQRTHIMGIVNVTPDSFSDGGLFLNPESALSHALKLVDQGADIIDIGGETTRPGSKPVNAQEEIDRVVPLIKGLAPKISVPISIDTYKSIVAERAIEAGAEIINDISALRFDPDMARIAAHYDVPVVLMHIKDTPFDMQQAPHYESLISEIIQYLRESIEIAQKAGIDADKIIIDPGIGFGKSVDEGHNLKIINKLSEFKNLGKPILVGPSRKLFIGKILEVGVNEREEGTAAAVSAAILNGANIVRVHNVDMTRKVVKVIDAIKDVN